MWSAVKCSQMETDEFLNLRSWVENGGDGDPNRYKKELAWVAKSHPTGPNFRATHLVHPFTYSAQDLIWKESRVSAAISNLYYAVQDAGFLGSRKFFATGRQLLEQEAEKLDILEGAEIQLAPRLLHFYEDKPVIVRSYVPGKTFREMDNVDRSRAIPDIVELAKRIHDEGIAIGDGHIKNAIEREDDRRMLWLGFSGVFDEKNLALAQGRDLVKLAYSTFTETRDLPLAMEMAEAMSGYDNREVQDHAAEIVDRLSYGPLLRFATRVTPMAHDQIKGQLLQSLK